MTSDLEAEVVALRAEVVRLSAVEAVRLDTLGAGCLIDGASYRRAAASVDLLRPIVVAALRRGGVLDEIVAHVKRQTEMLESRPDIQAVITNRAMADDLEAVRVVAERLWHGWGVQWVGGGVVWRRRGEDPQEATGAEVNALSSLGMTVSSGEVIR